MRKTSKKPVLLCAAVAAIAIVVVGLGVTVIVLSGGI